LASCHVTRQALKRCTSTDTFWNRKAPSLSSPEDEEIFLIIIIISIYYASSQHNINITNITMNTTNWTAE